jgi:soluble epoxide hydrolase/lipid-phosphate phosphatase
MVNILSFVALASTTVIGATAAPQSKAAPSVTEVKPKGYAQSTFDPNSYKKKFVTCNAVDRSGPTPKNIKLKLAYLDINPEAEHALIMVHGWPSLWTTYREQITDLGKDYRIILPENRGYGDSEHPKDLQDSNAMFDVCQF